MNFGTTMFPAATDLTVTRLGVNYALGVSRRPVQAVRDVTLTMHAGHVVGLVGESGSGKSSVARAIVGLAPISAGTVRLAGQPFGNESSRAQRRAVQMVFQNPRASLNPRRTVEQTLVEAVECGSLHTANTADRVAELLDAVALPTSLLGRRPQQMSGGQCQRIAIARALAVNPQFVLADEVTASLDAVIAAGVVALLRRLATSHNIGVLLITHDLRTVERIADWIAVMYLGKVVEQGSAQKILAAPRHPYTAALLAARPSLDVRRHQPLPLLNEIGLLSNTGCQFAPRCNYSTKECTTTDPTLSIDDCPVACHHPLDCDSISINHQSLTTAVLTKEKK